MADGKISYVLEATDNTKKTLDSASNNLSSFSEKTKVVAKGLATVTAAAGTVAAAVGTKAVTAFADFETRMGDLSTLLGANSEGLETMKDGILELTKSIPKSVDDLGASAYSIVSAGISDASQALNVLDQSGRLAVAGLSTTEEATNLLTTAINAFGLSGDDANDVADILFKTVKAGKTTVAELAGAFGKMAGNASAAGISLEDVQAATAALTTVTGKTSESQNALAQVFLELTVAGGKLDKALDENGSSLTELNEMISEKGLVGGFSMLRDQLGLTDTEFKNMFSSAEGGTAVYQLMTDANSAYSQTLEDLQSGTVALDEAFQAQNDTLKNQYEILKNNVTVAFIELGEKMTFVRDALGFLNDQIKNGFPIFQEIGDRARELIKIFDEETKILSHVKAAFDSIWKVFQEKVMPAFSELWEALQPFMPLLEALAKLLGVVLLAIGHLVIEGLRAFIETILEVLAVGAKLSAFFLDFVDGSFGVVIDAFTWLVDLATKVVSQFKSIWEWGSKIGDTIKSVFSIGDVFNGTSLANIDGARATGGSVYAGKSYLVGERGAEIFTPNQSGSITPNNEIGSGDTYNFTFNGDVNDKDSLIRDIIGAINEATAMSSAKNAW